MKSLFSKALDIRSDYGLVKVLMASGIAVPNPQVSFDLVDVKTEAYLLGMEYAFQDMPLLFSGTSLADSWECGKEYRERYCDDLPVFGTEEEWQALSSDQQNEEWDEFHDRCAIGTADDMYFYSVMMNKFLVGYVGH